MAKKAIRNSALFGRNLVVNRRIFSGLGDDALSIEDTLVNEGYSDEKYCLLYHINLGYPLLDEGGRIIADVEKRVPRTAWAAKNEGRAFLIEKSCPNYEECCYFLTLKTPEIVYVNETQGKKFTVKYSRETLPCFIEWKSMASGDYALGLEPCTSELDDKFAYKSISAGERIKFSLELKVENL